MNKLMTFAVVTLCAAVTFAAPTTKKELTPEQKAEREKARQQMLRDQYEYFGEQMRDTRNQKGKLVFVNCQKAADAAWLQPVVEMIEKEVRVVAEVADGSFDLKKPELKGDASIFIVDDPALPISLVASEAKWAMVNVAPLKTDKAKFFEMRVKKATSRAFALLCGAAMSQFPMALTESITTAEDFDKYRDERLPFDLIRKFPVYLKGYGITPFVPSNYRKACEQGWAPQPTNEVQKAIWEEVHTVPDKPLKIKFDPKKGK